MKEKERKRGMQNEKRNERKKKRRNEIKEGGK